MIRWPVVFYGILTDPVVGYERLAAAMVEAGVRAIQLRLKGAPPIEVDRKSVV